MENEVPTRHALEEGKMYKKSFMRNIFSNERKEGKGTTASDLNEFFHGPRDRDQLEVAHTAPPVLAKLDISRAKRWPNAETVVGDVCPGIDQNLPTMESHSEDTLAYHSKPPKRAAKGLVVRFMDSFPEIIGQGGDECETPTAEITKLKRARPSQVMSNSTQQKPSDAILKPVRAFLEESRRTDGIFLPAPLRRAPTGYVPVAQIPLEEVAPAQSSNIPSIKGEKRKSIIEIQQAEMRQAEGLAFAEAVRSANSSTPYSRMERQQPPSTEPTEDMPTGLGAANVPAALQVPYARQPLRQSPETTYCETPPSPYLPPERPLQQPVTSPRNYPESPDQKLQKAQRTHGSGSPASSIYSQISTWSQPYTLQLSSTRQRVSEGGSPASRDKPSLSVVNVVDAAGNDAMETFVSRTRHLFELYRLHSETVRPLESCLPEELMRSSLWWFLRGRMSLECCIRQAPVDHNARGRNEMARQQAHADLAKGYWLAGEIVPEVSRRKCLPVTPEVEEAQQAVLTGLRKLAMSMKRNDILPPEEALLPAHLDRSIWLEYPQLSQDIISLLRGSQSSGLGQHEGQASGLSLLECLPLGDSSTLFSYGHVMVDVYLMEQETESQYFYLPCLLSITRERRQTEISFKIASQNGAVQLHISGNRKLGPTWDDIKWRPSSTYCALEIKMPRGFQVVAHCSEQDHRLIWSMYDFTAKTQASLYPNKDERSIFRTTLPAFQYFDNDPQAQQFPKESVPWCGVAMFESILSEGAASGPRSYHRGFRVAVVTGPKTKTLSGFNQVYHPATPIKFGFLRSENNFPALSLTFESGKSKGSIIMSFQEDKERRNMHSLLVGTALRSDESLYCDVCVQGVWFSEKYGEANSKEFISLSSLPWQRVRVINRDNDKGDSPSCVLSEHLRIVLDFQDGHITDRVNVGPGELKLRLDTKNTTCMMVHRQPQLDLTLAITDSKSSRNKSPMLTNALVSLQHSPTVRTYMFSSLEDLHQFETALTGFKVKFDGMAAAFAIARRRMVVPIYKKWEAGSTRIQVVHQNGVTQLLVFFENFSHGEFMGLTLKGTDVFETFSRSGKAGLKIVDAKFPLPRILDSEDAQAAADAAFVCLDLPELPGEHDDISILFDSNTDRENFVACLPGAPVKGSLMNRIMGG